jgi:hypothetical protein
VLNREERQRQHRLSSSSPHCDAPTPEDAPKHSRECEAHRETQARFRESESVHGLVLASLNVSPAPPPGSGRHVSMLVDFMHTIAALEYRNDVSHNEVNETPQGWPDIQSVHVQC